MRTTLILRSFFLAGSLFATAASAAPKTYQVTGPVLEVSDTKILVQKGNEKWEIQRTPESKVSGGELKVGQKVSIEYTMTATTVAVKEDKKAKK